MLIFFALLDTTERDFYGTLYYKYRAGMWRYARSIVRDDALADDVVQLSFCKLMDRARGLETMEDYKVKAYIAVTIRNTAINALRGKREVPVDDPAPPARDEKETDYVDTYTSLPDTSRDAIILKHVYRLTNREIGVVLGITEEAAKKRVQRGLDALANDLKRGMADAE